MLDYAKKYACKVIEGYVDSLILIIFFIVVVFYNKYVSLDINPQISKKCYRTFQDIFAARYRMIKIDQPIVISLFLSSYYTLVTSEFSTLQYRYFISDNKTS